MLIQLQDGIPVGHPVSPENFRLCFSNVSFPRVLTPSDVEPFGFGIFAYTEKPNPGRYEKIEEGEPQKNSEGVWEQQWRVVVQTLAEQEVSRKHQAKYIRTSRNTKLTASDWTQLSDAPVDSSAWANYRQELRDIPEQEGFPWDIIWPDEPEA